MSEKLYGPSNRNKVKRIPKRGHYDQETIFKILDETFLCHVGFCVDQQPFVIPTAYGRKDDIIYLHGASTSRMLKSLEMGINACITVTHLDGLVLARSLFNHSMNYRSAVIFGKAVLVTDEAEKMEALKIISDQILKGRWEEARIPSAKEMKATSVLKLVIEEASAKIRTGDPGDEKADYDLDVWSGVIPIKQVYEAPINDSLLRDGIPIPTSVNQLGSTD